MTKPIHESAVEACRKYQEAAAEVERLTWEIGDALVQCPTLDPQQLFDQWIAGSTTHLNLVFRLAWDSGPEDSPILDPKEAAELLDGTRTPDMWGGALFDTKDRVSTDEIVATDFRCEHCLTAHQLIQQRKEARKRFGAAKRFVRRVGKRAGGGQ